jgi:hypothetical protein
MPEVNFLASQHVEEEVLNEYLDDSLDAAVGDEVVKHLAGCALCTLRLEDLRGVFQALEELPEAPLGRDLAKEVLANIAPPAKSVYSMGVRLLLGLEVVCAAALALALWPMIEANFTPDVYWQAVDAAALALMQVVIRWQEAAAALLEQLGLLEQWGLQWGDLPFSTLQVTLLLGVSVFAWLAVNGRLIGGRQITGVHQLDKNLIGKKWRKL